MSDIEQILYPTVLSSLREDIPPVKCIVWKGDKYEAITFKVYPFDTLDDIKRMICTYYEDSAFIPRFMFVGVPLGEDAYSEEKPSSDTQYIPMDYLWYPNGTNDPKMTYILKNPRKLESDLRFVSSDGSWASPNIEPRGRSLIEQIFLKPRKGLIPVFHVFPLKFLLKEYTGPVPISEDDWNKRFAPYFPDVKTEGPYEANIDDLEFAQKIHFFIEQREKGLDNINRYLEEGVEIPIMKVTGIRQLRLTWKKPVKGFEGCGSMFYNLKVTEKRPYLRLLPSEGSAITKLHVKGVLPIPSLEDPKVLEQWGKEVSPTHGFDLCTMKYVHRPSIGITQPIYGTIHIFNDGTLNLSLLPPKQIKKLDPTLDFRNFNSILEDVFQGLPQPLDKFELREIATLFTLKTSIKSKKFNKTRILQRLPYFQTFFQEIKPLPNETPIISLRYKAVNQYVSEDKTFAFLTQFSTTKMLDGESAISEQISALQNEFQLSKREAIEIVSKWLEQRGTFTVQIPEDGEFIESFNPGIDIHIYAQHPSYYFHVNRIDSQETYVRIFTLLSLLFIEENLYFNGINSYKNAEMELVSDELEKESLYREEKEEKENIINKENRINKENTNDIPTWMADDPFANEVPIEPLESKVTKQPEEKKSEEKKSENHEQKLINPKSWFIKKLQEIDPRLFTFKTDDKDDNGYSRKCAGYDDRQPSVLSKDQYERMREIYENDQIHWIVYPLEGTDEPIQPLGTEETITVMRYGSDQESINYYFCPQYYCLSDEIMILSKDFEATMDRDGNPKPPNTCPFCYGKLITDKKKSISGYTVIKRKDKKGATYHTYIDFMSKTTHPEGFALPCCFLKQTALRISDPQYSHLRAFLQETELEVINEEEEYDEYAYRENAIEYAVLFESVYKKYILESNKHPDAGIFATVPLKFDKYFKQNSNKNIITRVAIHLKLRPNAQGFLRIGTQNTIYESLLGVIAPLLFKNTIEEVRERILEVIVPRVFLNSHFGNLVLEFFNPADGSAMPPTQGELTLWASEHLGIVWKSSNAYALIRLYNAYKRFIKFIRDPTQRKDLRHIQPMLAEPGLFTVRGVQLIVMEDTDPITIKCPTFGVSMDRHKRNDFAFISRSLKNIGSTDNTYARYELYFHTYNKPAKGGETAEHNPKIRWDYTSKREWPDIVQLRIDEYMTQCQSKYRSIYTSQDINPMAMIPLSKAVDTMKSENIDGIVKDSYNHIVAITFKSKSSSTLVTLPVIDDGVISISSAFSIKNIYLDWDDYKDKVAPCDEIVSYYENNLEPLFGLYPKYAVEYKVKHKIENKIIAVRLKNGIFIPAAPPKDETLVDKLNTITIEQFQWSINKEIAGITEGCGFNSELIRKSTYTQFEELYQQFRLMVSNWITSHRAGSEIRKGIEEIIFNPNLPEYEKRKRMDLLLSSTFISWFYSDEDKWESSVSFLRKDCRIIDSPDACTGTCFWNEGRCLLHVDATTKIGERDVSTPQLFTKRVIDELVRFPIRRKQLMKRGEISKVSTIIQPIRQGDQYIIPESSPTWTNLLRLDWAKQIPEEPKYYEEMSREAPENSPINGEMPPELEEILGEGTPLRVIRLNKLIELEGILGITLEQFGLKNNITKENLVKYVQLKSKPIGIMNVNDVQFVRPFTGSFDSVTIIVFLENQIGILIEEKGESTVKIASLPEKIQELYENAGRVQIKKRVIEEKKEQVIIGQNPIMTRRRRPLVAPTEIKEEKKSENNRNRTRRRPRVAPE